MKRQAHLNGGIWKISCPDCGVMLRAEPQTICMVCFPQINALALKPIPGGLFRPVHDIELREQARQAAENQGRILEPEYPDEKELIEKIVRLRPHSRNMNWVPTETLEDLRQQNRTHGDPVPEE